jgi:2-phospho-L-lactate guanylyltransferase
MRTLAVLPIKRFDAAKHRLAGVLGVGSRGALAQAMFSDVLASLRRAEAIDQIAVVTADPAAQAAAQDERVTVIADALEAGQSAAAEAGVRHAITARFERVLLVPGDTPLLDAGEVDALLRRTERDRTDVTIVPDRHEEGTNALVIAPPDALRPSFGPGSLARHRLAADSSLLSYRVERLDSLSHDVDTPEDLAELWTRLDQRRGLAPRTRGALRQLDRSRVYGSARMAEVRDRLSDGDPAAVTRSAAEAERLAGGPGAWS